MKETIAQIETCASSRVICHVASDNTQVTLDDDDVVLHAIHTGNPILTLHDDNDEDEVETEDQNDLSASDVPLLQP